MSWTDEKPSNIEMGLGDLGKNSVVFVREFRFLLESELYPKLSSWITSVSESRLKRELVISGYEAIDDEGHIHVHNWADILENNCYDRLKLIHYDGCGIPLYSREYYGVSIVDRKNKFNCASGEVSIHEVTVNYSSAKTEKYFTGLKKDPATKVVDCQNTHPMPPMSMEIDEAEVHHLNACAFVPGKAKFKN